MDVEPTIVTVEQLLKARALSRRERADLPIEQKVAILVRLQGINAQLARQKGRRVREPWKINIKAD